MGRVFIYWDDSNIVHEAQRLAEAWCDDSGAALPDADQC